MLNKHKVKNIALASVALALIIFVAPMLSSVQNAQATNLSNTNTSAAEMKAVQDLTTKNLTTDEQQKNNPFFRIVWGDIQTITPGQSIALFADCNTGEFANSGLKIVGKDVQVLEDYPIALPDNSMSWLTVVYNGNSESLPVSNGVICVGDNGQSGSSSGVDSTTKNIIHNTINQFIQNGNTNILQLIQIQQILIQQAIQIVNITGNNNTVTQIINQTANQIANLNVTNPDIINNIGNETSLDNGVNPNQPLEEPVSNTTSTTTNQLPPGVSLNTNPDNNANSTGGSEILTTGDNSNNNNNDNTGNNNGIEDCNTGQKFNVETGQCETTPTEFGTPQTDVKPLDQQPSENDNTGGDTNDNENSSPDNTEENTGDNTNNGDGSDNTEEPESDSGTDNNNDNNNMDDDKPTE